MRADDDRPARNVCRIKGLTSAAYGALTHRTAIEYPVRPMSETPDGQPETGAWLTKNDAARFLQLSYRQVDRLGLPKRRLPGRLVEVWVAGATSDDVSAPSETSDGQSDDPDERAVTLAERVSDAVGRQIAPLLAALLRAEERAQAAEQAARDLARENGELSERLKASETQADADRQRLSQEVSSLDATLQILAADAARADDLAARLAAADAQLAAERAESARLRARKWWNPATW